MKLKIKSFLENKTAVLFFCLDLVLLIVIVGLCFILMNFTSSTNEKKCEIEALPNDNFVFLGDSITDYYPLEELYDNLPVINSGVAGYTTSDILDNIDEMVTIYNPTKVIILIGTNDIEKEKSNEEIFENIEKIVSKILEKRPNTKIYLESIYPINNTDNEKIDHNSVGRRTNKTIIDLNKKIKGFCKENNYTYIDMYKELVDKDGNLNIKYTAEGLHINDTGYLKITKVMYRYLQD